MYKSHLLWTAHPDTTIPEVYKSHLLSTAHPDTIIPKVYKSHLLSTAHPDTTIPEVYKSHLLSTGRSSSIGSESAWHARGPEFDPHVRHILSWRLGHENISTTILPLSLIQEEQLSVTDERMCTKYW